MLNKVRETEVWLRNADNGTGQKNEYINELYLLATSCALPPFQTFQCIERLLPSHFIPHTSPSLEDLRTRMAVDQLNSLAPRYLPLISGRTLADMIGISTHVEM